jgi:hypothetical protein
MLPVLEATLALAQVVDFLTFRIGVPELGMDVAMVMPISLVWAE